FRRPEFFGCPLDKQTLLRVTLDQPLAVLAHILFKVVPKAGLLPLPIVEKVMQLPYTLGGVRAGDIDLWHVSLMNGNECLGHGVGNDPYQVFASLDEPINRLARQ